MKKIIAKSFYPDQDATLEIPESISELNKVIQLHKNDEKEYYNLLEVDSHGVGYYKGLYTLGFFKEVIAINLLSGQFLKRSVKGIMNLKKDIKNLL